jgi:D-lactate dehydrogenase (cytochrome)
MISPDELVRSDPETVISRLQELLGEDAVLTSPEALLPYETDAMPIHRRRPMCVILPPSRATLMAAVTLLHETQTPWTARGAGSGLSGGALAENNGVLISLARLREILSSDPRARRVEVEPGVVNQILNQELAGERLQFAPDPSSQLVATIGGNIAENAGGPHTLKHGVTVQHFLGCRLVLSDATELTIGGSEETMGGYDLLGLIAGSEGTLGLVTSATLRLIPLPESTRTFMAVFPDTEVAGNAVAALLGAGVVPSALEMIDAEVLDALESAFSIGFPKPAGAFLVGEVDGLKEEVAEEMLLVTCTLSDAGASEVRAANSETERVNLWRARKQAFGALGRVAPNYISHDVVIPRSVMPAMLRDISEIGKQHGLRIANIFHAGDGNLHPAILFDAADPAQAASAHQAGDAIVRRALDVGGVLTGEHGIGLSKRKNMAWAFSEEELALLDRLRRIFDPWNLSNPGKLIPAGVNVEEATSDVSAEGAPAESSRRPKRDLSTGEASLLSAIQDAYAERKQLIPVGGGTLRITPLCGRSPLPMRKLNRILAFEPADFAVTVESGVTLAEANDLLVDHGQQLSWEAPDPQRATLGGIVSAGYWSSQACRFGHPKYSLLGFRGISGGGEIIQFGATVVKNVSGYDLAKLIVGACGTLAVTTRLTLRTYPLARCGEMIEVIGNVKTLLHLADRLAATPYPWSRLDLNLNDNGAVLHVGFQGNQALIDRLRQEFEAVFRQVSAATEHGPLPLEMSRSTGKDFGRLERGLTDRLCWFDSALILKLVVGAEKTIPLVSQLLELLEANQALSKVRLQVHPTIGLVRVAIDPGFDDAVLRRLILEIAEQVRLTGGYRALDRAPGNPWWGWDGWGASRTLQDRMQRIGLVFDPRSVLPAQTPEAQSGAMR